VSRPGAQGDPDAVDPDAVDPDAVAPDPAADRRNVADRYRGWSVEAVRADLAARSHPFHVAVENLAHDFNIGSVVRSCG
jgi:tRNA G18 (ribose-2'-O)-methylase SpoU